MMNTYFSFRSGRGLLAFIGLALLPGVALAANPVLTIQGTGPTGNDVTAFVDKIEIVRVSDGSVVAGAVANASFETFAVLSNGNYGYTPAGASWTFNARSGIAQNRSDFASPDAPDGISEAFIQSRGGVAGAIAQTLALGNGTYQVRFLAAQRNCCGTNDQSLDVLIDGVSVGTVLPANNAAFNTFLSAPFTITTADLVVSTGTQLSPTPIPAGTYNSITVTGTGNGVLAGPVSVNSFFVVQSGGGLSDGCATVSGPGSFTLAADATLGICDAAGISAAPAATGAIRNTGTRSFSTDASYGYNGTAAQATGSGLPATVRALATINPVGLTLTAPVAVTQAVGVGGPGNLLLNGQDLTLRSGATGTAIVVNSGTGIVSGSTARVQRYIDPSLNPGPGYRHFSAPVSGSTVADLATGSFAPVVNPNYNTSATPGTATPFPTVFGYEQGRLATVANNSPAFDKGFVSPGALGDALAVGYGYTVNIAASELVDFVGQLTSGTQTVSLGRNAAGTPNAADAGWHLLGNPYPAPLDYSLVAPADRPNLDGAMYVYQSTGPYVGQYRSYNNNVGNPVLPVGQAFFVRVSAGQTSGSLTFRNGQRLTAPTATPFQRTAADLRPLVQLELHSAAGPADVLYAYAEAGATAGFDSRYDAEKLPNSTGLNLSSVAGNGEALAIDGRPAFTAATVLPLTLAVPAAGTYSLAAAALSNLPAGLEAILLDAATGQRVRLGQQASYSFQVSSAQAASPVAGRFTLAFAAASPLAAAPALAAGQVALYPNPAHAAFTVQLPAGAPATRAELLNALGQVVRRPAVAGPRFTVETAGLAPGLYTLRLQAGGAALARRVVVE